MTTNDREQGDKQFYWETGKTADQESRDTSRMLALAIIACILPTFFLICYTVFKLVG